MITQAAEELNKLQIFIDFNQDELAAFVELADPVQVKAGSTLVRQDEKGDCMYIIIDGTMEVAHRDGDRTIPLAELGPGEFFGELALVEEGPRSADVVAKTDGMVLKIPQALLRALAGVYPNAAFKLLMAVGRVLVSRIRKSNRKYIDSLLAATA